MSWDGGVTSENKNRPAGIDQMAMRLNQVCRSESGRSKSEKKNNKNTGELKASGENIPSIIC
jgi:hypothetical protein